jgi:hypothetical protein
MTWLETLNEDFGKSFSDLAEKQNPWNLNSEENEMA